MALDVVAGLPVDDLNARIEIGFGGAPPARTLG